MFVVIPTAEGEIEDTRTFETEAEADAFIGGWGSGGGCYGAGECVAYREGTGELEELKDYNPARYAEVQAAIREAKS